jgi:CheY-like chemotaxis protein
MTPILCEPEERLREFVAMLAHELRNPLAPMRNALSVIRVGGSQDVRLEWAAAVMDRQLTQLTRLIDMLLDASRIARGQIVLERKPVALNEAVVDAVEAIRALTELKVQQLDLALPEVSPVVEGDLVWLTQVVTNLVQNAVKFTPTGGHVGVHLDCVGNTAVLRVVDNGCGIDPELLPNVFDLFAQGARGLDRSEGGLGIGLSLVRHLVELHGGTVQARSNGRECGSEFTVRLPLVEQIANEAERPSVALRSAAPLRVLVVDDNRDSADSMVVLLRLAGHRVHSALDGPSALKLAVRIQPQVVLLDIGLPGMSGYEVARALRADAATHGAAILAMTGYGQDEDRRLTHAAGFDAHFVKPVNTEMLMQTLAGIAGSR